jgi:uncharacterized membrane protein YeaQ/YmgE (transglycosylase-associated protein family)
MSDGTKDIISTLLDYGFSVVFFMAGIFGAIASLLRQREMSLSERFITILSGGGTAAYITPMIVDMVGLHEGSSYGMAFIVGFAGLKMVEWIISAIKSKLISGDERD